MIAGHRLATAPFVPTPNMGGAITPSLLVLHYTVSWPAKAVIRGFQSAASKASAHLVLDLDGTFTQMVPFNQKAWHAGESEWKGLRGCNGFSIGIEIVNPGPVFTRSGGWRDVNDRAWVGPVEPHAPPPRYPAAWKYWATYAEPQLSALETVCRELCREYAISEVVGHSDISPGRKYDPGPAFPMQRIRKACGLLDTDPSDLAPDSEPTRPDHIAPEFDPAKLPVLQLTLPRTTGKYVVLLQERLRAHSRIVSVDGNFGPKTDIALRDCQKSWGLPSDGLTTRATWAQLLKEPGE